MKLVNKYCSPEQGGIKIWNTPHFQFVSLLGSDAKAGVNEVHIYGKYRFTRKFKKRRGKLISQVKC